MKLTFDIGTPALFILIFIVLALIISIFVYYKNREHADFSLTQTRVLAIVKFFTVFLCLFLLLKPLITSHQKVKTKPLIIIATDNSRSMSGLEIQVKNVIRQLDDHLGREFKLDYWIFGERAQRTDSITVNDNASNYSNLFNSLNDNYINQSIDAVIILGDGIYNSGTNPQNSITKLTYPIYTIGFGDTTRVSDAKITDIKSNKTVYINNYLPIDVDLNFEKLANQIARIEVLHNNQIVFSKSISIVSNNYFTTEFITILANEKGLQKYQISINPMKGETNFVNNTMELLVNVIENKQKILVLSDGPHPDIGTLKSVLENYNNFELTIVNGNSLPDNLNGFGLIILNQLPSTASYYQTIYQKIPDSKIPLLFIVGEKTSLPQLSNLNLGLQITQGKGTNEVQYSQNPDFNLFKLDNEYIQMLSDFPPLFVPNTEFSINNSLQVLANQKIKGIETKNPMIALGTVSGRKIGYLFGEGIYRWRNYNYSLANNYNTMNDFVYKIVNYLILKDNENNFNIYFSSVYSENEEIIIDAELFNDSYELINQPDVSLILKRDNLSDYHHTFDKIENKYRLNLGNLEAGTYMFDASVNLGEKELKKSGTFAVSANNIENQETTANFRFLNQLAQETDGIFIPGTDIKPLIDKVSSEKQIKPHIFSRYNQNEFLNMKWLFIILIFLFGLEWFLRKYWGIY